MSVTFAELGKIVGCSTATVSRALNNSGSVSSKTREAILKALQESRNAPRGVGRERRMQFSSSQPEVPDVVEVVFHRHSPVEVLSVGDAKLSLGPLVPLSEVGSNSYQFAISFHRQIIDGAIAELSRWGYRAVLQFNTDLMEPKFLLDMNKPDKRGVLLVGEPSEKFNSFVERCRHPLVLADFQGGGPHEVVTSDNYDGIFQAFDHLYALGHRKIGFAGNQDDLNERYMAYRTKMAAAELPVNPEWLHFGMSHIELIGPGVMQILSRPDRPTAMVCANDCYAIGSMRAAAGLGISIPSQLSIVGFDDIDISSLLTPALTTVHVPQAQIGQQAARQLMLAMQMNTGSTGGCKMRLKTDLIVRGSTGPVASS